VESQKKTTHYSKIELLFRKGGKQECREGQNIWLSGWRGWKGLEGGNLGKSEQGPERLLV
jgi:hypothetical protein